MMPSRADLVPALRSPRYQGVEDPNPRQSRLKYLIIASVFLFSVAILIFCIVGLIYSSQPHFLPATLAVGTGASVLVIGFILVFLKCWNRIRSRLPAIIPGNSRHGFEVAPDDEGSGYGGFRGWMTMDMPTKIAVAGVAISDFLSRTGDAIFGPSMETQSSGAPRRSAEESRRDTQAFLMQDHPYTGGESSGKMSTEEQYRCNSPTPTVKTRLSQESGEGRGRQASANVGTCANQRDSSHNMALQNRGRGHSASGTRQTPQKFDHGHIRSISSSPSQATHYKTRLPEQSCTPTRSRNNSASLTQTGHFNDTNPLKDDLTRARHGAAGNRAVATPPSQHGAPGGRPVYPYREDSTPGPFCQASRSHSPLTAPIPVHKPSTPGPQVPKSWDEYIEMGKKSRSSTVGSQEHHPFE
ncbi:hypothetical protein ACHAQA_001504 [Verticillium albo-atrum]